MKPKGPKVIHEHKFSDAQFDELCFKLNAIDGAINRLADRIAPVGGKTLSDNLAKWIGLIAEATGNEAVLAEIAKLKAAREQLEKAEENDGKSGT